MVFPFGSFPSILFERRDIVGFLAVPSLKLDVLRALVGSLRNRTAKKVKRKNNSSLLVKFFQLR